MSGFFWIILITAILLIIVYSMYFSPSFAKAVLAASVGPYDLKSETSLLTDSDTSPYYAGPEGGFSAFVYLNQTNRTGSYAPCGTNPNQASCSNGTFAPCPCAAPSGDCSVCTHVGYNTVFNIADLVKLEVLIAPDASRQGKAMAQLIIKTEGPALTSGSGAPTSAPVITPASQKYIETLLLPPIPTQKWTMITVSREGRRFDVYYNNTVVLSQKTMYMPIGDVQNTNFRGVTSGSVGLGGQFAMINVYNYRPTSQEVAAKYQTQADTRGRPYIPSPEPDAWGLLPSTAGAFSGNLGDMLPSFSLCPKGGCLDMPVVKPASPLFEWTGAY